MSQRTAQSPGTLYVVATPIGHPDDISQRARACLRDVDLIAAEDTRVARTLLSRLEIAPGGRLRSLFEANEASRVSALLDALAEGRSVALISDAGTPLVSDPGYRLVCATIEAGLPLHALPGPSAALAALVVSGLPPDRVLFCGFLPRKASRRRAAIEALSEQAATLLIYEAPHRVADTLCDLSELLGERRAVLARQLTKPEEEVLRGTLSELAAAVAARRVHGEVTLVVEGSAAPEQLHGREAMKEKLLSLLTAAGLTPRQVRDIVHEAVGGERRELYQRALALTGSSGTDREDGG